MCEQLQFLAWLGTDRLAVLVKGEGGEDLIACLLVHTSNASCVEFLLQQPLMADGCHHVLGYKSWCTHFVSGCHNTSKSHAAAVSARQPGKMLDNDIIGSDCCSRSEGA